jgi:hypothetical protein
MCMALGLTSSKAKVKQNNKTFLMEGELQIRARYCNNNPINYCCALLHNIHTSK